MIHPLPFAKITAYTLLRVWASTDNYDQMVISLRQIGYVVTPQQIRRKVRRMLRQLGLLPIGRPPEPRDYARIKIQLITDWDNEDIL